MSYRHKDVCYILAQNNKKRSKTTTKYVNRMKFITLQVMNINQKLCWMSQKEWFFIKQFFMSFILPRENKSHLWTISIRTIRPSSWALSINDFSSSGVPNRLLGAKKLVTWYLQSNDWLLKGKEKNLSAKIAHYILPQHTFCESINWGVCNE